MNSPPSPSLLCKEGEMKGGSTLDQICQLFSILKRTGSMNQTFTSTPPCFPGLNFGSVLTTLIASLSSKGSMLLSTSILPTDPSGFTTNFRMTLPWTLFFSASDGYFRFSPINLKRAVSPPGYCGFSSTTMKIFSSIGISGVTGSLYTTGSVRLPFFVVSFRASVVGMKGVSSVESVATLGCRFFYCLYQFRRGLHLRWPRNLRIIGFG